MTIPGVNCMSQLTLHHLQELKNKGDKFACMTAYDALFSQLLNEAGVEVLLVGDSLGMVLQGHSSTLPVTMEDILYHLRCVHRGNTRAVLMGDLPFMSYSSPTQTLENAALLMRNGANIVKLEGGAWIAESTRLLSERGIPVCAHMGLTPQSINRIGGHFIQGRDPKQATTLIAEAKLLEEQGACMLLLECVPVDLADKVTKALKIPVIGIGAGPHTDGQIMVLHDALGISPITPKFVKNFLSESSTGISGAFHAYTQAVKKGTFPADEHCYF
jgi:3-methyl-2-oxobutanoate hydroxymethyltransferase